MLSQNANELYDFVGKIVVIGESSVGKTNILSRYCKNEFNKDVKMTIGVEFFTKIVSIDGKTIKFQIWDTAGQERYKSITKSFFTSTSAAIIVFDIADKQSFNKVDFWINEVTKYAKDELILLLIGNKCDLVDREVTIEDINHKIKEHKIDYYETSAMLNTNINNAFENLITKVYDKMKRLNDNLEQELVFKDSFILKKLNNEDKKIENKKGCC